MNNGLVGRLTSSLLALFEAARQGGISYLAESLAAAAENAANEDAAEIEGGEYEGGEYDGGEFDGGEDEGGENDESADDEAKDGAEGEILAAIPVVGHTKYRLSYDGIVIPPENPSEGAPRDYTRAPTGVTPDAWRKLMRSVRSEVRRFGFARGEKRIVVLLCKFVSGFLLWAFFNLWLVDVVYSVSFIQILNNGIIFTVFYLAEEAVFKLPGYMAGFFDESYEVKLYNELQERIYTLSKNSGKPLSIRLVLRFGKDTRHPRTPLYLARRIFAKCSSKVSALGSAYRYDLNVLPWDILQLPEIKVGCPNCGLVVAVNPRESHFRCTRCLACSPLDLPTLAVNEILDHESNTTSQVAGVSQESSQHAPRSTVAV